MPHTPGFFVCLFVFNFVNQEAAQTTFAHFSAEALEILQKGPLQTFCSECDLEVRKEKEMLL